MYNYEPQPTPWPQAYGMTYDAACADAKRRLGALDPRWLTASCADIAAHIAQDPTLFKGTICADVCIRRAFGSELPNQTSIDCPDCPLVGPPPPDGGGGVSTTVLLVGIGAIAAIAIAMSMQSKKKIVIARVQPGG